MRVSYDPTNLDQLLLELLRNQKSRMQQRLQKIKEDDGTYFGEGMEESTYHSLHLIESLIEVFSA